MSVLMLSGCTSHRDAKGIVDPFVSPFDLLAQRIGAGQDLFDATMAFVRKNGRWPKDYTELETFVQGSDGYLTLGHYDNVDLSPQVDGGVVITYVIQSTTNRIHFGCSTEQKK